MKNLEMSTKKLVLLVVSLSFTISIGLIMLFEFNDTSNSVKTENLLGIQCPEKHYLSGYDVSGQPICKMVPMEYLVSNATMIKVLKGEKLDHIFNTASQTFVSTGFPVNNKFIKKYDDSEIWVFLTIDHRNTEAGRTNFIALWIDKEGNDIFISDKEGVTTIWAYDFSSGGAIQAFTGVLIADLLEAGEHTIDLLVAVNGGTGKFKTDLALLDIYEIPMELP